MSCDRYRDALTDAAAGEPVAPPLEVHLAACASCRSELVRLGQLMAAADGSLAALASAEPSPALRARIREAVASEPAAPALPFRLAWPVAAAVVVAVAALGAWRTVAGRAPAGAGNAPPPAVAESSRRGAPATAGATALPGAEARRPSAPQPRVARVGSPTTAPAATSVPGPSGSSRSASATLAPRPPSSPGRSALARSARRTEPEVLVAAGGQEALLRYVALVHRQGLLARALSAAGEPSPDLAEPKPISIRPIEIAPLDPAEDPET